MRIQQQVPSEVSTAADLARQLLRLQGPAVQAPDNSAIACEYLSLGGALKEARDTNIESLDEAFVDTALQMLSEWESMLGLVQRPDLSVDARRTRLIAKVRAARAGTPQSILRAINVYDSTATINEINPTEISPRTGDGVNPGTDRDVYSFGVAIASSVYSDTDKSSAIRQIIDQMKPAHTAYVLVPGHFGFILDQDQVDINAL